MGTGVTLPVVDKPQTTFMQRLGESGATVKAGHVKHVT